MSLDTNQLAEIDALGKESRAIAEQQGAISPKDRARFDWCLSRIAAIRSGARSASATDEEMRARVTAAAKEIGLPASGQERTAAFETYIRKGKGALSGEEQRALTTDTASAGYLVAAQWADGYLSALKSYSGIREAGATVKSSNSAAPFLWPVSDDGGNTGTRNAEGTQPTLTNPVASLIRLAGYGYNSQGIIISNALVEDLGFDLSSYLQDILAKRIGRITNTEFTLGASGGPSGLMPNFSVGVTASSQTAVLLSELNALPASLDYGYRQPESDPTWMFSTGVESALKSMTATNGQRLFPEMDSGKLLGYRCTVNVDMASSLSAGGKVIAFGSFKRGVAIRQADPCMVVSRERYAELNQSYYILHHRQDCQITDPNAVKLLQMHA